MRPDLGIRDRTVDDVAPSGAVLGSCVSKALAGASGCIDALSHILLARFLLLGLAALDG